MGRLRLQGRLAGQGRGTKLRLSLAGQVVTVEAWQVKATAFRVRQRSGRPWQTTGATWLEIVASLM